MRNVVGIVMARALALCRVQIPGRLHVNGIPGGDCHGPGAGLMGRALAGLRALAPSMPTGVSALAPTRTSANRRNQMTLVTVIRAFADRDLDTKDSQGHEMGILGALNIPARRPSPGSPSTSTLVCDCC